MVNFWSFAVIAVALATSLVPFFQSYHSYIQTMGPLVFRVFFTWCVGPLALSIATFRNSLVFHSSDQIIILAVHISPNLAVYGMKWWASDLMSTFGNIFPINCRSNVEMNTWFYPANFITQSDDCPGSFRNLVMVPILSYITLWSIPYFLFFFFFGVEFISKGDHPTNTSARLISLSHPLYHTLSSNLTITSCPLMSPIYHRCLSYHVFHYERQGALERNTKLGWKKRKHQADYLHDFSWGAVFLDVCGVRSPSVAFFCTSYIVLVGVVVHGHQKQCIVLFRSFR